MSVVEELRSDDEVDPCPVSEVPAGCERVVDVVACERLKKEGNALFVSGKVAEALEVYRDALKAAPIKPIQKEPKNKKGGDSRADGRPSVPETQASSAPAEGGGNSGSTACNENDTKSDVLDEENNDGGVDYTLTSQIYCNAGLCLTKLEFYEDAVTELTEAIRHNGLYAKAFIRRAECYYLLGKWSNAYGDYEEYEKLGGVLDADGRAHKAAAKAKVDEEMKKMLGDLKDMGNRFLNYFGLSTDNFKFDKDPVTGGYSMRFEK
ncbi:putative TPR repeat [Trypanosoma cruzi]|nr:putative TPR repeat [Trypanosoma cruzi]